MRWLSLVGVLLPFGMAACVNRLPSAAPGSQITVVRAQQENLTGQRVRWGGEIANITSAEHATCFEVRSHPLGRDGRPTSSQGSVGRFIACARGFYPHDLYEGQQLTVVGTLRRPTVTMLGAFTYRYPRVAVEKLHFWPERESHSARLTRDWSPSWEPWESGSEGYWW